MGMPMIDESIHGHSQKYPNTQKVAVHREVDDRQFSRVLVMLQVHSRQPDILVV
jgi:hypothetical protein